MLHRVAHLAAPLDYCAQYSGVDVHVHESRSGARLEAFDMDWVAWPRRLE